MSFLVYGLLFGTNTPIPVYTIDHVRAVSSEMDGHVPHEAYDLVRGEGVLHITEKTYRIWTVDYSEKTLRAYGGRGEAPGAFRPILSRFFRFQDQIHVVHGTGTLVSVFDSSGKLLDTQKHTKKVVFSAPKKGYAIATMSGSKARFETPVYVYSDDHPEGIRLFTEDFRILRMLNPKTKSWSAYKVMLGKYADATHFTNLGKNRWAAMSSTEVIFFDLLEGKREFGDSSIRRRAN